MTRIVVGTDGSAHATTAMRWGADEAELHGSTLEVVLAWSFLDQHHPDHADRFDNDYNEAGARAALAAWVTEALGADAVVEQRVVCDLPARALLEASDAADLVVLGARGTGGFEGLLLGSVSERVAQLATRPVAVIRTGAPVRGGRVVVGIDGSARSLTALRWAAAEARIRDSDLDVVHAWPLPTTPPAPSWSSDGTYGTSAVAKTTMASDETSPATASGRASWGLAMAIVPCTAARAIETTTSTSLIPSSRP
ncbi:MAG: universal stress protein [Acidimicrobiales bacterium]|nr:universal stress protein [Acidimicrobiales bacterium]